jgi:hypothetical protein
MAFPGTFNFNYYRGDTNQFVIRPKNASGSAFDLTGYTAQFRIANRRGSTGTQYEAQVVVDTANDLLTCTILPGVGRQLAPGTFVYDVQITTGAANILTVLTGSITVTDDITGAV